MPSSIRAVRGALFVRPLVVALVACVTSAGAQTAPSKVRVASSGTHTLVVSPDGTVLCQGRNQHGVCAASAVETFVATLSPVPGMPKARAVAVPDATTSVALGEDGKVYVWGENPFGLFGGTDRGPTYVRAVPTAVPGISGATDVVAMVHAGAALKSDGTVWMWGEDQQGIMGAGTVTLSGQNGRPQYTPARVAGLDGVVQIACGSNYMLALKADGTVWSWGANKYGQLGMGDTERRGRPTNIPGLSGVTRIYADGALSAARQGDGAWVVWGAAPSASLIAEEPPPVLIPTGLPGVLRDATELANGVAQFRDGTVRTWGSNSFGSLGTGRGVDASVIPSRATIVRTLSGIVQVWSGNSRSLALKSDGTLYVWGPSGSNDVASYRVPVALGTFRLEPRVP